MTLTLTTIMGEDLRALGFHRSEEKRLKQAWAFYRQFEENSMKFWREARNWQYAIVFISVATTVMAVLAQLGELAPKRADAQILPAVVYSFFRPNLSNHTKTLSFVCGALPLLSTFLLSGNSRFAPLPKFAELLGAAAKVESTIYMYRARVGEFQCKRRPMASYLNELSNGDHTAVYEASSQTAADDGRLHASGTSSTAASQ